LRGDWDAPIYVFSKPPFVEYINGRKSHVFECGASHCRKQKRFVRRYLDKTDKTSTGNLHRHARGCWGVDVVAAADATRDGDAARAALVNHKKLDGSIVAMFRRIRIKEEAVTYSHRQHTKAEARVEFVRWVCENTSPCPQLRSRAYARLIRTGRPNYYIPSAATLANDVKNVFLQVRRRISTMLKEYDGNLSFASDAWTSPNH
ncbi:hypothetical protein EDB84DRAFT_1258221, partial [Lactarius hengduanensis]